MSSNGDNVQADGSDSDHNLAMPGALSHWTGGGMYYDFHWTIDSTWHTPINNAAAHLERNTLASQVDELDNADALVSVGHWPRIIGTANNWLGWDICDTPGVRGGMLACAYPSTSTGRPHQGVIINDTNHLSYVNIILGHSDV